MTQLHCSIVGQPVPFVNGQQTQTHVEVAPTVIVASDALPLIVPGSPEPLSPSV